MQRSHPSGKSKKISHPVNNTIVRSNEKAACMAILRCSEPFCEVTRDCCHVYKATMLLFKGSKFYTIYICRWCEESWASPTMSKFASMLLGFRKSHGFGVEYSKYRVARWPKCPLGNVTRECGWLTRLWPQTRYFRDVIQTPSLLLPHGWIASSRKSVPSQKCSNIPENTTCHILRRLHIWAQNRAVDPQSRVTVTNE